MCLMNDRKKQDKEREHQKAHVREGDQPLSGGLFFFVVLQVVFKSVRHSCVCQAMRRSLSEMKEDKVS